jgi:perosamine synthetase
MKPIFIASNPNFEQDDYNIVKDILNGNIPEEEYINSEKKVKEFFERSFGRKATFFNSGRAGLYEILKNMQVHEGDEVIIQAMTCLAVPLPILWHKAKPIYADIDENTYSIDIEDVKRKITEKTKAVVVTHMFGRKMQLEEFRGYIDELNQTRKKKIYLIEDCAHILNPNMKIYGDYAFFSFAQDKPVSCMTGGAVLGDIKDTDIEEMSLRESQKKLKSILLWKKIKDLYYKPFGVSKISFGKFLILYARYFGLTESAADPEDLFRKPKVEKLSKYFFPLLNNQINKLEKFNNNRKKISRIYGKEDIYLRYPVQCSNPKALREALRNEKVIIGNWYNNPVYPRGTNLEQFGYILGSCPKAEKLSKNILNLPTNIEVGEEESIKIKEIADKFCK